MTRFAAQDGVRVISINWDVAEGLEFDLRNPSNVRRLVDMLTSGVFAGVHAGPPCSTWSAILHSGSGPPYVRTRECPWGRPDLEEIVGAEKHAERLAWGTWYLLCAYFALHCVAYTGGSCSLEHPQDRGHPPYPSIWDLPETEALESVDHPRGLVYQRVHFHQCMWGGWQMGDRVDSTE